MVQMKNRRLFVLIACEESQAEVLAFRALGHHAYSCDLQPVGSQGNPEWHVQGDVRPLLQGRTFFRVQSGKAKSVPEWDLIICHPPCIYLCRASIVQMKRGGEIDPDRYNKMLDARQFFEECLQANAPYVAVENPIPMKMAGLACPSFYVSPHQFGDSYTKKTCYWVRNLPPLMPTVINPTATSLVASTRGKYRSRTSHRLAVNLALQWADFIVNDLSKR